MKRYLLGGVVLTTIFSLAPLMQAGASGYGSLATTTVAMDATYKAIYKDLGSNSVPVTTDEALFRKYSAECVDLAYLSKGIKNDQARNDFVNVAVIGNGWAWAGYVAISTGSNMTSWKSANVALATAFHKLSLDVRSGK